MSDLLPRVVVVSTTSISDSSASGFCMKSLFHRWPADSLFQISAGRTSRNDKSAAGQSIYCPSGVLSDASIAAIEAFKPDLFYVRAVEWPESWWDLGKKLATQFQLPYVAHIFDDVVAWQLAKFSPPINSVRAVRREQSLENLLQNAVKTFSCSQRHSDFLHSRYGIPSIPFVRWIEPSASAPDTVGSRFRFAYRGRCNPMQHSKSLKDVVKAIRILNEGRNTVMLDCIGPNRADYERFFVANPEATSLMTFYGDIPDRQDQLEFLQDRDASLVTLNFDQESIDYVGNSISSKALDALSTNYPTLIYGSPQMETVSWAKRTGWGDVVAEPNIDELIRTIKCMIEQRGLTHKQEEARNLERKRWSKSTVLHEFEKQMQTAIA